MNILLVGPGNNGKTELLDELGAMDKRDQNIFDLRKYLFLYGRLFRVNETNYLFGEYSFYYGIVLMTKCRESGVIWDCDLNNLVDEYKSIREKDRKRPILIVLNKIDLCSTQDDIDREVKRIKDLLPGADVETISAKTGYRCEEVFRYFLRVPAKAVILGWWKKHRHYLKSKRFQDVHRDLEHKPGVGIEFFKYEEFVDGVTAS